MLPFINHGEKFLIPIFSEIQQQESILLDGQTFAAVPNLKMVVAEIQPVTIDQPDHGILGTKSYHKGAKYIIDYFFILSL